MVLHSCVDLIDIWHSWQAGFLHPPSSVEYQLLVWIYCLVTILASEGGEEEEKGMEMCFAQSFFGFFGLLSWVLYYLAS